MRWRLRVRRASADRREQWLPRRAEGRRSLVAFSDDAPVSGRPVFPHSGAALRDTRRARGVKPEFGEDRRRAPRTIAWAPRELFSRARSRRSCPLRPFGLFDGAMTVRISLVALALVLFAAAGCGDDSDGSGGSTSTGGSGGATGGSGGATGGAAGSATGGSAGSATGVRPARELAAPRARPATRS